MQIEMHGDRQVGRLLWLLPVLRVRDVVGIEMRDAEAIVEHGLRQVKYECRQ